MPRSKATGSVSGSRAGRLAAVCSDPEQHAQELSTRHIAKRGASHGRFPKFSPPSPRLTVHHPRLLRPSPHPSGSHVPPRGAHRRGELMAPSGGAHITCRSRQQGDSSKETNSLQRPRIAALSALNPRERVQRGAPMHPIGTPRQPGGRRGHREAKGDAHSIKGGGNLANLSRPHLHVLVAWSNPGPSQSGLQGRILAPASPPRAVKCFPFALPKQQWAISPLAPRLCAPLPPQSSPACRSHASHNPGEGQQQARRAHGRPIAF